MNRKVFTGLSMAIMLLLATFTAIPVSAHTIKTDGEIKALLHINPNDAPTSGTTSSLLLTFQDSSRRFILFNCNCEVAIQENGKTIYKEQLNVKDPIRSSNDYVFPKSNVYTIKVTGQPKTDNGFQSFALSYTVRVEKGVNEANSNRFSMLIWIGLSFVVGSVILLAIYQERSYNKRHKKEH